MSKQEILERYLNVAYFGHRAYGIYAAAEIFFSKTPKRPDPRRGRHCSPGWCKAPTAYDPASPTRRRRWTGATTCIDRMADIGYLAPRTTAQAKARADRAAADRPAQRLRLGAAAHNNWGFFCDEFKNWWMQPAGVRGQRRWQRQGNLRRGGYRIVTSLDPKMQEVAMDEVRDQGAAPAARSPSGWSLVEPGTGRIKAMAVNRVYSLDQPRNAPSTNPAARRQDMPGNYPNTVTPLLGGGDLPGYQAGSTFKMFTMLAALEQGMPLDTAIYSPHDADDQYLAGLAPASCGDYWCPPTPAGR